MYDELTGSSLVIDELHVHEEFDAAQYGTWTTNGVIVNNKQILGVIPTSETEDYLNISSFAPNPIGLMTLTIKVDVAKSDVLLF